jgi:dimethylglycine dehydrogenase
LTNGNPTILVIAGPRHVMSYPQSAGDDWSKEAFQWLSARECLMGSANPQCQRQLSGELAYESMCPTHHFCWPIRPCAKQVGHGEIFGALAVIQCGWKRVLLESGYSNQV